jgi:2-polyprenyl-6-methoxyphenol hydroxylase-like FAD-dependent oxidoreductase
MEASVLVVGAGPTGLVLGIELARRNVPVRVVDRATAFATGSRGDGLQPRTLEVFDDIGVLDAVLDAGAPPAAMRAYAGGRFVGERRMHEWQAPRPDVPHPNGCMLGQDRTEAILRARFAELGGRVELGTALQGLTQDATGVTAALVRADGEPETVRVAALVGADGGASTVRRALGIPFEGRTDESLRLLLGDVRVEGLDHATGYWFADEHDLRRGIAMSPLPGGDLFQFGMPLENGDAEPTEALRAAFAEFCPLPDVALREVAWSTVWRPNVRLARRFRDGRVFLAGDAAHAHPPTGGQGLNTSVQDAYNLGWKLAAALAAPGPDSEALLDSYEAERRPVAERVLGLSEELLQRHVEGAPDAHERGQETRQLDIGYRGSPIVHDGRVRPGRLHAGDRAPDAPVIDAAGRAVRLFDLFRGPHATLLVFGDPAPVTVHDGVRVHAVLLAGRTAAGNAVVDADGHVAAAYDVPDGTAVLVRPDGYVGALGEVADKILDMYCPGL